MKKKNKKNAFFVVFRLVLNKNISKIIFSDIIFYLELY